MESLSFKEFDNPKFPVKFSYPETARYYESNKKKYSYQVSLRERKEKYVRMSKEEYEKYRKYGGGTLKSVFPKLVVTIQKVYVPAYQTADRKAYFMDLQGLLKLHGVKHWISAFSGTIESFVETSFGGGTIYTFKHDSDDFYRSYVFLVNFADDKLFLSLLYMHKDTDTSFYELRKILDSISNLKPGKWL